MSKSEQAKSAPLGASFSPEALLGFNSNLMDAYARALRTNIEASSRFGEEFAAFVSERMRKDTELAQELSTCRTWSDAAEVQSRWMRSTAEDYAREMEKVMEIVSDVAKEAGSEEKSRAETKPRSKTAAAGSSGRDASG